MPGFRQRPLTWLFLIAAACVAMAAGARDKDSAAMHIILTGQVYVVAAWAAVGRMHRLARGALLFLTPLATALAIYLLEGSPAEARAVLAATLLLGAIVFASTACGAALVRAACAAAAGDGKKPRWQISIIEIMGWTVVVAIASLATKNAELPPLEHIHALWGTLASAVAAGLLVALFLTPGPKFDRAALVLAALVLAMFFLAVSLAGEFDGEDSAMTACLFAYVALWILVMRLDESVGAAAGASAVASDQPQLKLHEQPFDEPLQEQ